MIILIIFEIVMTIFTEKDSEIVKYIVIAIFILIEVSVININLKKRKKRK